MVKIRERRSRKMIVIAVVVIFVAAAAIGAMLLRSDNKEPITTGSQIVRDFQDKLPELKSRAEGNPQDFAAQREYAIALYAVGDTKAAKTFYERALDIKSDAMVSNNLGNVYRDLGDFKAAEKAYRESIKLAPKTVNAYTNLANIQLYSLNKADEAIVTYQAALREMPENTQLQILLAAAYEHKDDVASARQQLQKILTQDPDNKAARANLDRLKE